MLSMKNISVDYGPISALDDVSMNIGKNNITAIIGANGSGKSTLLKTISGLTSPKSGEVNFEGNDITKVVVENRVKKGIAHVMEGRRLFKNQTVHDNLLIASHFRNLKENRDNSKRYIMDIYNRFNILEEKKDQLSGTLSGGQQQLLIISMALLSKPRLLLLDEPSLGLAPVIVDQVYDYLKELKSEGVTIIVAEQIATLAIRIADYGYVLEHGKVVKYGDVNYLKSLIESNELSSVYLGT